MLITFVQALPHFALHTLTFLESRANNSKEYKSFLTSWIKSYDALVASGLRKKQDVLDFVHSVHSPAARLCADLQKMCRQQLSAEEDFLRCSLIAQHLHSNSAPSLLEFDFIAKNNSESRKSAGFHSGNESLFRMTLEKVGRLRLNSMRLNSLDNIT